MSSFEEYYLYDSRDNQIYTKNSNGYEVYPTMSSSKYAYDKNGRVVFVKDTMGNETYAYDSHIPIIPYDSEGYVIYAKDSSGSEVYPIRLDTGDYFFPKNLSDNLVPYAKDANGRELYPYVDNIQILLNNRYALNEFQQKYYPKDFYGDEVMVNQVPIIKDDIIYYPLNSEGDPIYPTDIDGNEFYMVLNGMYFKAFDPFGNYKYAHRANLDEYYPPDNAPITSNDGFIYARSLSGKIIFPKNASGSEYYFTHPRTHEVCNDLDSYCKNASGREVYPKTYVNEYYLQEVVIGDKYALDESLSPFYPLDTFGNEYAHKLFLDSSILILPSSYPITNDQYIIVPKGYQGRPYIQPNVKPSIEMADIVGMLFRPFDDDYTDYLTRHLSPRKSRSAQINYTYKDRLNGRLVLRSITEKPPSKGGSIVFWIEFIIFVLLMVVLFLTLWNW